MGDLEIDYVGTFLGCVAGPLILIYGNELKSLVTVLSAMYAASLIGLLKTMQKYDCFEELEVDAPTQ
jgi:hypothetical protein